MSDYKFRCNHCDHGNEAGLHQVGQEINCASCGVTIIVPRPRVRLAGSFKRRTPNEQTPVAKKTDVLTQSTEATANLTTSLPTADISNASVTSHDESTIVGPQERLPSITSEDTTSAPRQLKTEPRNETSSGAVDDSIVGQQSANIPLVEPFVEVYERKRQVTANSVARKRIPLDLIRGFGLGLVFGIISYLLSTFIVITPDMDLADQQIEAHAKIVVQRWQSALARKQTIEDDLRITLAEFEYNNMPEAVNVREAIAGHETGIEEDYQLALEAASFLHDYYNTQTSQTERVLSTYRDSLITAQAHRHADVVERLNNMILQSMGREFDQVTFRKIWDSEHTNPSQIP